MTSKEVVILHTAVDDNDSSWFLLVYHRMFNLKTVKKCLHIPVHKHIKI